jgi:4-amino-4-deoxy-L-arabinose transferase-like glycosyltransferase
MLSTSMDAPTVNLVKISDDTSSVNLHRWHRWIPLAIFAASILVTVSFWQILPASFRLNEASDYLEFYEPVARNLVAGQGLTLGGQPDISHPPGYSLVLAGVFEVAQTIGISDEHALAVLAALGMGLISVLIFYLARTMWGMLPAVVAAFFWMTYPFALWLTKQPNSEIPFMVVFYVGFLLFWHAAVRRINSWVPYAICGFLFGMAMLIRPIGIGLAPTMAIVVWLVRRDLSKHSRLLVIMALLIGNAAAVLPWEIWSYSRTGRVVLLGTGGVGGIRDGLTFGARRKDYREETRFPPDVTRVMSDLGTSLKEADTLKGVAAIVGAEARAHPVGVAKLFLLKIARSWYGTDSLRKEGWILLIQSMYLFPLIWGIRRVWRQDELQRQFMLSVLVVVVYFWTMSVIGASLLRFMVPVTGLIFVLISGAFSPLALRVARQRSEQKQTGLPAYES